MHGIQTLLDIRGLGPLLPEPFVTAQLRRFLEKFLGGSVALFLRRQLIRLPKVSSIETSEILPSGIEVFNKLILLVSKLGYAKD